MKKPNRTEKKLRIARETIKQLNDVTDIKAVRGGANHVVGPQFHGFTSVCGG